MEALEDSGGAQVEDEARASVLSWRIGFFGDDVCIS